MLGVFFCCNCCAPGNPAISSDIAVTLLVPVTEQEHKKICAHQRFQEFLAQPVLRVFYHCIGNSCPKLLPFSLHKFIILPPGNICWSAKKSKWLLQWTLFLFFSNLPAKHAYILAICIFCLLLRQKSKLPDMGRI